MDKTKKPEYIVLGKEKPERVVVIYRSIMSYDPITKTKKPISLVRLNTEGTQIMLDTTVKQTLKRCGWRKRDRKMGCTRKSLCTKDIKKFLLANMCNITTRDSLWIRLFEKSIPDHITSNVFWKDLSSPQGTVTFDPGLWLRLFEDIDCRIAYDILRDSRPLAIYSTIAQQCGIDHTTRILPFIYMENLIGKNYTSLINDDKFMTYMYNGRLPQYHERVAVKGAYDSMASLICNVPNELENAWVMLICSSYFRGQPLSPVTIKTKTIPMLKDYKTKEEEQAEAEEAARLREVAESERLAKEAAEIQEAKSIPQPEVVGVPSQDNNIPEIQNPFVAYPDTQRMENNEIANVMKNIVCERGPTPAQEEFIRWLQMDENEEYGSKRAHELISKAFEDFKIAAIYGMVDPWRILSAIITIIVSGSYWKNLYGVFLDDYLEENGVAITNALKPIFDPEAFCVFLKAIDISGIKNIPAEIHGISSKFLVTVGSFLKMEDKLNFEIDFPRMMLAIYYKRPGDVLDHEVDWIEIWKGCGWSVDTDVISAISKWKLSYSTLPYLVRAMILATVVTK